MPEPFIGKDIKAKKGETDVGFPNGGQIWMSSDQHECWLIQVGECFLRDHALEWWTTQKDLEPNLMGILPWSAFKAKLNETPHN
jgi:hypothetical protein